jgi:hypothetical protein
MNANRRTLFALVLLSALLSSWNVSAIPLQARDLFTVGDGGLTYDSETDCEWLDLGLTCGLSWTDVESDSGGWISRGFRHATFPEVMGFWADAGFADGWTDLVAEKSIGESYLQLTSATVAAPDSALKQLGMFDWTHPSVPDGHVLGEFYLLDMSPTDWVLFPGTMRSQRDCDSSGVVGHYLVRDGHDVPESDTTVVLLSLSLAVMMVPIWRRQPV